VTVEDLLDSRGPAGRNGPSLVLADGGVEPDLPPGTVTALLSPWKAYAEIEWNERPELQGITIMTTDEPPQPMFMKGKGGLVS
jgi:hypothetical protein